MAVSPSVEGLPETTLSKQSMKLHEVGHRNARFAHLHAGAKCPIQHPFRDMNDFARPNLHPHDRATSAILTTFMPKTTTVKWAPSIMNFY